MNPALVEIARILLQFEVERLERQQQTAAASQVSQAQDAMAASTTPAKPTQQVTNSIARRKVKQRRRTTGNEYR